MKYTTIILLCLVLAYLLRTVLVIIFRPARNLHDLLMKYPDAEQTAVFLPSFPISILYFWREPRQICAKIEEMRKLGWTYLRSSRVQDGRLTLRGVTLHFIRTDDFKTGHAA
jgi:hypothetical protein